MADNDGAIDLAQLPPAAAAPEPPGAEVVPLRRAPATRDPGAVLTIEPHQVWWNDRQLGALRNKYPEDEQPSDADLLTFLHLCIATGLDPFRNEIYYIGRKDDRAPGGRRFTAQTGIDGYRHIAERTGEFAGRLFTQWCGRDGEWRDVWLDSSTPPAAARVAVARKGFDHPFYGVATYAEFVPLQEIWEGARGNRRRVLNEDGSTKTKPMGLWSKMPSHMLAKCAEAQALRSAFPRQLAGLYVEEEMHQADAADAAARAEAGRESQRAELSARSWMKDPVEGEPAGVVEGRVLLPPREALLEELANQARIMDTTLAAWCRRWVAAHKKNVEDADDRELWELATSRREIVAAKAAEAGVEPVLATVAAEDPAPTPDGQQDAQDANDGTAGAGPQAAENNIPAEVTPPEVTPPAADAGELRRRAKAKPPRVIDGQPVVDVGQPQSASETHDFVPGDGDEPQFCGFMGCQLTEDEPVHRRVEATGQEPLL